MKSMYQEEVNHKRRKYLNGSKQSREKAASFAMNFMNKGNFIQKQILESHIKRIKTEHEYESHNKHERIKTEEA